MFRESVGGHEVGLALEDRADELLDVQGVELAVGIDVDHDVRAGLERLFGGGAERLADAAVRRMREDVIRAGFLGNGDGPVVRSVIDHVDEDLVNPVVMARDASDGLADLLFLVERGDVDYESHKIKYEKSKCKMTDKNEK